jgi:hypothetical protein
MSEFMQSENVEPVITLFRKDDFIVPEIVVRNPPQYSIGAPVLAVSSSTCLRVGEVGFS